MGLTIGSSDNNSINNFIAKAEEDVLKEAEKANTIFSVEEMDVNGDGKIDNNDFKQWSFIRKFANLSTASIQKLEKMYIEYAFNHPNNRRDEGELTIVEFDMPFAFGSSTKKQYFIDKQSGNILAEKSVKTFEKDGITSVEINTKRYNQNKVKEHEVKFQYNKEALENYVFYDAKDEQGNDITYFDSIPEIRAIPEEERTEEQKKLLKEFDDMIKYTIQAGIDYGVDPKLILSIIQQEVGFKGLSDKVVGVNGKGYMQLTSAPVNDYLGLASDNRYHDIKEFMYGPEAEELLASRGFAPQEAQTQEAKRNLYKKIYNYLKENKDPEFNIRLGTIVLRYYLDKADGDVKQAAKWYNGSGLREKYALNVNNFNQQLEDTVPNDTIYNYRVYTQYPRQ